MKLSAEQFRKSKNKAVTLLGMSGVGKTRLADKLDKKKWFHYSGDYRIGTKYLEEPILDNIKAKAMKVDFLADLLRSDSIYICSNITVDNLEPVSTFLGKIGNPELDGLPLEEFKRRQNLHRDAENRAMFDVPSFIAKARDIYGYPHFINDAGGSLCELDDPRVFEVLAEHTAIIYIHADKEHEETLSRRAIQSPKPLYFNEAFLDKRLSEYMSSKQLSRVEDIVPDEFGSWVFPKLLEHRKPLYAHYAEKYGYTIEMNQLEDVHNEQDFLELVCQAMSSQQ